MRGVERVGDLDGESEKFVEFHGAIADGVLERGPFEILHHDVRMAAAGPDLMNGADIRVIQRGCGARLAAEAFERPRVGRHVVRQELERDPAAELAVLSFVDDAHPAAAQLVGDAIVPDCFAQHGVAFSVLNYLWGQIQDYVRTQSEAARQNPPL